MCIIWIDKLISAIKIYLFKILNIKIKSHIINNLPPKNTQTITLLKMNASAILHIGRSLDIFLLF